MRVPALSVSDFDTVECPRDNVSALVLHVRLPNGAEIELDAMYSHGDGTVTVGAAIHQNGASRAFPAILFHEFTPCQTLPPSKPARGYVS